MSQVYWKSRTYFQYC